MMFVSDVIIQDSQFFNVLFLLLIVVNYCDQGIIAYSAGKY